MPCFVQRYIGSKSKPNLYIVLLILYWSLAPKNSGFCIKRDSHDLIRIHWNNQHNHHQCLWFIFIFNYEHVFLIRHPFLITHIVYTHRTDIYLSTGPFYVMIGISWDMVGSNSIYASLLCAAPEVSHSYFFFPAFTWMYILWLYSTGTLIYTFTHVYIERCGKTRLLNYMYSTIISPRHWPLWRGVLMFFLSAPE